MERNTPTQQTVSESDPDQYVYGVHGFLFRSRFRQRGYLFFKSDYFISQCVGSFNGVVGQQRVSKNIIENMIIAIPPINEQKRIACAVHKIFAKLDMIMESL